MANKSRFHVMVDALHPEVTGSCIAVRVNYPDGSSNTFLVDCGIFNEKDLIGNNTSFPFDERKIDFVLVTHNHVDHNGRLPLLFKGGFKGKIYTSDVNNSLMPTAIRDNEKVMKLQCRNHNTKFLYSDINTRDTIDSLVGCTYYKPIRYSENIIITFFPNGHLLGAALILVQLIYPGYEGINLLFTGDYNDKNALFEVNELPNWVFELPLTIVMESTYGKINSEAIKPCFSKNVEKALISNSTVICPVFSQGRAQDVLYNLKKMQSQGIVDRNIPIYLDGNLAIKYTEKYKASSMLSVGNFIPDNFSYVDDDLREKLIEDNNVKIILASSGMGSFGPANQYLNEYIGRKNTLIHFTGYCAKGTAGREIKDSGNGETVKFSGRFIKKYAEIEFTKEFSAHAKADELIKFLQKFSNLKMVLLNHGTSESKELLAVKVLKETTMKNVGILGSDYCFRINAWGYDRSFPTCKNNI